MYHSNTQSKKLLTAYEAADILNVHMQTIYKYLRNGKLKGIRLAGAGSVWRIDPDDLEKFIKRG